MRKGYFCGKLRLSSRYDASAETPAPFEDEWVERLYHSLLEDDYKAVMEQLADIPAVKEKCVDYEYTEWALWDDETAYKMTAGDGTVVGIVVSDPSSIYAFVSYGSDNGFSDIMAGDHFVGINTASGICTYIKGGYEVITINPAVGQSSFILQEGEGLLVWHV